MSQTKQDSSTANRGAGSWVSLIVAALDVVSRFHGFGRILRAWPSSCERLPISWRLWRPYTPGTRPFTVHAWRQAGGKKMCLLLAKVKQKNGHVSQVLWWSLALSVVFGP